MLKYLGVKSTVKQMVAAVVNLSFYEGGQDVFLHRAPYEVLLRRKKILLVGLRVLDRCFEVVNESFKVVGQLRKVVYPLEGACLVMEDRDDKIAVDGVTTAGGIFQDPL